MKILRLIWPPAILLMGLLFAQRDAFSQGVECISNNGPVTESLNGSSCDADATLQSNAEAEANNLSDAVASAADQSNADSDANQDSSAFSDAEYGSQAEAQAATSSSADSAAASQSTAESQATDNGTATTEATNGSSSAADASDSSQANAIADGGSQATGGSEEASFASSESASQSSAQTCADDNSNAAADASDNSAAIGDASDSSFASAQAQTNGNAEALAGDLSSAEAIATTGAALGLAQSDSSAFGQAQNNGVANAVACDNSSAAASAANGGFAFAFAQGGGTAAASDTAPPVCDPGAGTASVRSSAGNCGPDPGWSTCGTTSFPITFSPDTITCAGPICINNVSISGSMEGNLRVKSGDTLRAGFDFTVPGDHPADTVTLSNVLVTLPVECPGNTSVTLSISMPNQTIIDPAHDGGDWFPSGNQSSPLVYQGSITVPAICGGATGYAPQGATFTAYLTASTPDSVHVRFHYSDATSGSWSSTHGYCN